jgi:hypothetical protein
LKKFKTAPEKIIELFEKLRLHEEVAKKPEIMKMIDYAIKCIVEKRLYDTS